MALPSFRLNIQPRALIAGLYDALAAAVCWMISFRVAYGFTLDPFAMSALLWTLPVVLAIQVGCFATFRIYRGIWRYASFHDFRQIAAAVGVSAPIVTTVLFLWSRAELVPRSALLLDPILLIFFMAGGRIFYRWWKEHRPYQGLRGQGKPVLVLGAGDAGYKLVMQLARSQTWSVVGLLDDNRNKVGRDVYGAPVLGSWDNAAAIARSTGARHALLAVGTADRRVRRRAFDLCEPAGLRLLVVPDIDEMINGHVRVSSIRDIEVDDLLGRDPVSLDVTGLLQMLAGRTVLVTGAGGSIGSELCRQIARFSPRSLVLFDSNEYALYRVHENLLHDVEGLELHPVIGDVKDGGWLDRVFEQHSPQVVFHAAAYKHVPLMENENAWQVVQNNTLGTATLMDTIERHPVEHAVFVSTDKAVNPTSVMGASKRLAELLLLRRARRSRTQAVVVRFGNVLGSTGSVVPKFKEQIARGGPITITDPDIRRYFMSVSEAAQLVLQAKLLGNGGEVFVLDMGAPVRIVDLARDLIRLSGLTEEQIPIEITGLRPGEKLYEELLADSEATLPTRHPKLRISRSTGLPDDAWEREVMSWLTQPGHPEPAEVRAGLARFIPEYTPYGDTAAEPPSSKVIPLHVRTA
ncbi:MAG: nucleoside-diphosphate sugar epimerase/dehydratase [Burkholderiaceae bacterium]